MYRSCSSRAGGAGFELDGTACSAHRSSTLQPVTRAYSLRPSATEPTPLSGSAAKPRGGWPVSNERRRNKWLECEVDLRVERTWWLARTPASPRHMSASPPKRQRSTPTTCTVIAITGSSCSEKTRSLSRALTSALQGRGVRVEMVEQDRHRQSSIDRTTPSFGMATIARRGRARSSPRHQLERTPRGPCWKPGPDARS
jgi:hypothetical protein